jgi:hypothetical protein
MKTEDYDNVHDGRDYCTLHETMARLWLAGEDQSILRKFCPSATSSTSNPTCTALELDPCPCLGYNTISLLFLWTYSTLSRGFIRTSHLHTPATIRQAPYSILWRCEVCRCLWCT